MSAPWWDTYYHSVAHRGIDIPSSGNVYASKSGTAYVMSYSTARGYWIVIDHGNGYYSEYQHLKKDSIKIKNGSKVNQGDIIATAGSTGNSTGNHLHFEIMNLGKSGLAKDYGSYYYSTKNFVNVDPQSSTPSYVKGKYISNYSNSKGINYKYQ